MMARQSPRRGKIPGALPVIICSPPRELITAGRRNRTRSVITGDDPNNELE